MLRVARNTRILIPLLFLPTCALNSDEIRYVGTIEKAQIARIRSQLESGHYNTIRISSPGGPALDVLELLDLIQKYNLKVKIDNYCMSSCAEIIFLTDAQVEMVNSPLLGFHGNAFTSFMLTKSARNEEDAQCYYRNTTSKFIPYVKVSNNKYNKFNLDFLDKYKPVSVFLSYQENGEINYYNGCPVYGTASKNKFWFPDSDYLKGEMGLEFKGQLAADDISLATKKIKQNWPQGTNNVVGNIEVSTK